MSLKRRVGREERSGERTSLCMESQRGHWLLTPEGGCVAVGSQSEALGALTSRCPSNPADLPAHLTEAAPPWSDKLLQGHRAQCRPESSSKKLGKHSGTASMLNSHLSRLRCFQGPISRLGGSWGCEGNHAMMAMQTFPLRRRGKIQQMAMFTCCYTQPPQKVKGYFNCETEQGWGGNHCRSQRV